MKNRKFLTIMLCVATAVSFTACAGNTRGTDAGEEDVSVYDDVWDGTYDGEEVLDTDQTIETESYNFTGTNTNGLLIKNSSVSFGKLELKKNSEKSRIREAAVTKGLGAACLVMDSFLTVSEGDISTNAAGATGVFTYTGGNTDLNTVNISTEGVYSPGTVCAGGASATLSSCTITTEGREAAGLRCTDPDSYMNVMDCSVETKGKNSPGVYVGTSLDLTNSRVTSYSSEVMRFVGPVSSWTEGCTLVANKTGSNANDFNWSVIACADEKPAEGERAEIFLSSTSLESRSGGMFYLTNTNCAVYVDNCELINSGSDDGYFIRCQGNNDLWGKAGSNGATCHFELGGSKAEGNVYYDSTSELDFFVTNGSEYKGSVKKDEKFAGEGGSGHCTIGVQDGCRWIVTEGCEFENLQCSGEIVDEEGKAVTVKGADGTVYMEGESGITVTVGTFSDVLNY
ncbi:MAG: hypothetical protein IKQ56_05155 [Lachnospiraceae bacterium]|nr:hypothetical protein [Lachnospiraceae bacterium]